jgi:hypothetical protein
MSVAVFEEEEPPAVIDRRYKFKWNFQHADDVGSQGLLTCTR